jgi:hypothetical protein
MLCGGSRSGTRLRHLTKRLKYDILCCAQRAALANAIATASASPFGAQSYWLQIASLGVTICCGWDEPAAIVTRVRCLTAAAFWTMMEIVFSFCRPGEDGSRAAGEGSAQGRTTVAHSKPDTRRGATVQVMVVHSGCPLMGPGSSVLTEGILA